MYERPWCSNCTDGVVYQFDKKNSALGNNKKQPKHGDLVMCCDHTGDGFHEFICLRQHGKGVYQISFSFGAYWVGKPLYAVSNRQYHLLLAGETVSLA